MPNSQIRRNLTPCQATGLRDANRIPRERVAMYRCHIVGRMVRPLMASIALKRPERNRSRSNYGDVVDVAPNEEGIRVLWRKRSTHYYRLWPAT